MTAMINPKILDRKTATSILCGEKLLDNCPRMKKVAGNWYNNYYNITGTNTCIAHIEQGFCILTSYLTDTYSDNQQVNLPKMLSLNRYGVYQTRARRDVIKNTTTSRNIGYDILEMVYGNGIKTAGKTQEHYAETWNEKLENIDMIEDNINHGSHKIKIEINDEDDLRDLISRIERCDGKRGWLYPKLIKKKTLLSTNYTILV